MRPSKRCDCYPFAEHGTCRHVNAAVGSAPAPRDYDARKMYAGGDNTNDLRPVPAPAGDVEMLAEMLDDIMRGLPQERTTARNIAAALLHSGVVLPSAPAGAATREDALRSAAAALVAKLDHPQIKKWIEGTASFAWMHGLRYDGPNYAEELNTLRELLRGSAAGEPTG